MLQKKGNQLKLKEISLSRLKKLFIRYDGSWKVLKSNRNLNLKSLNRDMDSLKKYIEI